MTERTQEETKQKIADMIKDISVALMATQHADGRSHARPMVAVGSKDDFEGTLWFFTRANSEKVADIKKNPNVLLTYAEPKEQNYLSLTGTAELVRDKDLIKDLWSEHLRTWFPQGTDDPEIALIRFDCESAEYWDTPSSVVVYAYGYVKARLTGKSPNPGDVGHIDFKRPA